LSQRQAEQLQAFINNRRNFPSYYMPDDKILKLVIAHRPDIRIVVATMGKIFMQPGLLEIADALCVDECQQTRLVDVRTMVNLGSHIKQLFIAGDDRQLAPYIHPSWEKADRYFRYGTDSVADFFLAFLERMITPLDTTYRFNEAMVPFISETLYDGQLVHGGASVIRTRTVEFNIPVCTKEVPIILVHSTGEAYASHGQSLANPDQEDIACNILGMIRKLDPAASITVLCCYAATAKNIESRCQHYMTQGTGVLKVSTIPAYIGNEADYEIFVTSKYSSASIVKPDFVHEPRATTVALTRAKECQWIIGQMDYLAQADREEANQTWMKMPMFIRKVAITSPPVDAASYSKLMCELEGGQVEAYEVPYNGNILVHEGDETKSYVAACKLNQQNGWLPNAIARQPAPAPAQQ
jgi:hypothetical protein